MGIEALFQAIASSLNVAGFLERADGSFNWQRFFRLIVIFFVIVLLVLILTFAWRNVAETPLPTPTPALTPSPSPSDNASAPPVQRDGENDTRQLPPIPDSGRRDGGKVQPDAGSEAVPATPSASYEGASQKTEGNCSQIINGNVSGGIKCDFSSD
ncbi:hypothetical protein [Sphingobium terrigena]|uniref:hypothetical protein n=1 Tax=Sphingobium terrigena TaxID=2304063 RepID=UPI0011C43542|nr:hypothetical protein [Sphingobium terrigena]